MDFVVRRKLKETNSAYVYIRSRWASASCEEATRSHSSHPEDEDDDTLDGRFSIEATDGSRAWRCAADVKYPEEGHAAPELLWYRYARIALSTPEHDEDKVQACLETAVNTANSNHLQVRWSWLESQTRWSAKVELPLASPANVVPGIIDKLMRDTGQLERERASMASTCATLTASLQVANRHLATKVDAKVRMEEELYGRFAAVLNTKKQRIAQLEEQLARHNVHPRQVVQPAEGSEGTTVEPSTDSGSKCEEVKEVASRAAKEPSASFTEPEDISQQSSAHANQTSVTAVELLTTGRRKRKQKS